MINVARNLWHFFPVKIRVHMMKQRVSLLKLNFFLVRRASSSEFDEHAVEDMPSDDEFLINVYPGRTGPVGHFQQQLCPHDSEKPLSSFDNNHNVRTSVRHPHNMAI
eukprot:m.365666 g.365666  ORF g.365666 m.365666 type:complete len:107 (-) comp16656_c0_seq24:113-433(-)